MRTDGADVDRRPGGSGEGLEGVLDQLERQLADALSAERQVDHRVRAAAEVDDRTGQRFIHRHPGIAEPGDTGPIAERRSEGAAQDERDVLDGVVLVDVEVAVRPNLEVEQAVVAERAEQVVPEADAGGEADRGPLPSRSTSGGHGRLACRPADARPPRRRPR